MLFDEPAVLEPREVVDWWATCSYGLDQTRHAVMTAVVSGEIAPGLPTLWLINLATSVQKINQANRQAESLGSVLGHGERRGPDCL